MLVLTSKHLEQRTSEANFFRKSYAEGAAVLFVPPLEMKELSTSIVLLHPILATSPKCG